MSEWLAGATNTHQPPISLQLAAFNFVLAEDQSTVQNGFKYYYFVPI